MYIFNVKNKMEDYIKLVDKLLKIGCEKSAIV